jgi:hypothetical protein
MAAVSISWFDAVAYVVFERANGMRLPPRTATRRVLALLRLMGVILPSACGPEKVVRATSREVDPELHI